MENVTRDSLAASRAERIYADSDSDEDVENDGAEIEGSDENAHASILRQIEQDLPTNNIDGSGFQMNMIKQLVGIQIEDLQLFIHTIDFPLKPGEDQETKRVEYMKDLTEGFVSWMFEEYKRGKRLCWKTARNYLCCFKVRRVFM